MSDAAQTEKTETTAKPAKKRSLVPLLIVASLLLGGAGASGYWVYAKRGVDQATPPPPPTPGVVDMEPFIVNLADQGGSRFLRVKLQLLMWDEEQAAEVKEDPVAAARIRSGILELLSIQHADALVTPEGKQALKKAIAERATEGGPHAAPEEHQRKVIDVLFAEFVVQ